MKPRTKHEKHVVSINKKVRKLYVKQEKWMYKNVLFHKAIAFKSGKIYCLDCSHMWIDKSQPWQIEISVDKCPCCKTKIEVEFTRTKTHKSSGYANIYEVIEGYQVIRSFEVNGSYFAGKKADKDIREVSRIFISPNGKTEVIACTYTPSWYGDNWGYGMELRHHNNVHKYSVYATHVYPKQTILPELEQRGFEGNTFKVNPYLFMSELLGSSILETLLKLREYELIEYYFEYHNAQYFKKYWNVIKMGIRLGYSFKDPSTWFDHIKILEKFNRDIMSPKYSFPKNLKSEHARYIEKDRRLRQKEKLKELKKQLEIQERNYAKDFAKYLKKDLVFEKDDFVFSFMRDVMTFVKDGDQLHHCIYSSEYYEKKDSLMFQCFYKGELVESLQYSISQQRSVQCRGLLNKPSMYHKELRKAFDAIVPDLIKEIKRKPKKKVQKRELAVEV